MTAKERLDSVIALEEPDRVPVHDFSNLNNAFAMGCKMADVRWDAEKAVKAALDFNRISRSDFIFPCFDIPALYLDLGVEVSAPEDNYGSVKERYFGDDEAVDGKEMYDPFDPKESPWFTKGFVNKIELLKKEMDPGLIASGFSWGVFTMAGELRGTEQLLMDLVLNPDLAKKVMKKSGQFVRDIEARCIDAGADICWMPDPTASESVISTDQFREFGFEPDRTVISHIRQEYGVPTIVHICGDTTNTMEVLPELNVDVFSVDQIVDIGMTKEKIGDRIAIMGNVHPIETMWNGTPEKVEAESVECMGKAAMNGGFILSTGCEIPRDASKENVAAMARAAETRGRYR
ncbi:MAG: uroporphyrinogen decarboxylase family protein [Methanomassiliicoccales archaeon]